MIIVIPKADRRVGKSVFVAERAQARRVQQKIPACTSRSQPKPTGSQNPKEVAAGKKQHISRNCADAQHYAVRPLADLGRGFPSRTTVPEDIPVGASAKNLGQA